MQPKGQKRRQVSLGKALQGHSLLQGKGDLLDLWNLFSVEASGPKGYRLGTGKEGLDMGWEGRVTEREGATVSLCSQEG